MTLLSYYIGSDNKTAEFEYASYYAVSCDPKRREAEKRYAYRLPTGAWIVGVREEGREDDRGPLRDARFVMNPDFDPVIVEYIDDVNAVMFYDGENARIGHILRSPEGYRYRIVDMFFFGWAGWDAIVEPIDHLAACEYAGHRFKWISSRAIDRTYHHDRDCPCHARDGR